MSDFPQIEVSVEEHAAAMAGPEGLSKLITRAVMISQAHLAAVQHRIIARWAQEEAKFSWAICDFLRCHPEFDSEEGAVVVVNAAAEIRKQNKSLTGPGIVAAMWEMLKPDKG